ncbi:MAG: kelch-like protein [Archangiaceae bacterium]|nr:kelch-like protein [Archangiaceae bacterium]
MSALLALLLAAAPPQLSGRFKPAGALAVPRIGHTATLLKDGRVLVAGGRENLAEHTSCELFNAKKNGWAATAKLATGRSGHTATLLDDGRVLVVGGVAHEQDRFVALASCELYDPKTGRWSAAAPMHDARNVHTATKLTDGRVLVAGGVREQQGTLATVEVYDPKANTWSAVPPMHAARSGHRAVLLESGAVLVTGGRDVKTLQSSELFEGGKWEAAPDLSDARQQHSALLLGDGHALVVGGIAPGGLSNLAELWRPGEPGWKLAEHSLSLAHASFGAVVLKGGDVLLTGGEAYATIDTPLAQRFVTAEQRWCIAGQLMVSRKSHTATLLDDGRVLITGGVSSGITESSAEIWEAARGSCSEPPGLALEP